MQGFPLLRYGARKGQVAVADFAGLNQLPEIGAGELALLLDMLTDYAPALVARSPREIVRTYDWGTQAREIFAVTGATAAILADGVTTRLYVGGEYIGDLEADDRLLARFGKNALFGASKQYYNEETGALAAIEAAYTAEPGELSFAAGELTAAGVDAAGFAAGDGVEISGCAAHPENNKTAIVRATGPNVLTFDADTFTAGTEANDAVTIRHAFPDLDGAIEHNNRLWGYKGRTIYASKLGDFKNWNVFDGLSTDSYALDTGGTGDFTGVEVCNNHPVFFKENSVYEVYGTKPANFQTVVTACPNAGAETGFARAVANVAGALFYRSWQGIMIYSGGMPQLVSRRVPDLAQYPAIAAATDGRKYYAYCPAAAALPDRLYVYDTLTGQWAAETMQYPFAGGIAAQGGSIVALNDQLQELICTNSAGTGTPEGAYAWSLTTGQLGAESAAGKYNLELFVDAALAATETVRAYLRNEDDADFVGAGNIVNPAETAAARRIYRLRVSLRRGKLWSIRLAGSKPGTRIHSIRWRYAEGSER